MMIYKWVLLPIKVVWGKYCFGDGRTCEHFRNEAGVPRCDLGICTLKFNYIGCGWVKKPEHCSCLENQYKYDEEEPK